MATRTRKPKRVLARKTPIKRSAGPTYRVEFRKTKGSQPTSTYSMPTDEGAVLFALRYAKALGLHTTVYTPDGFELVSFNGAYVKSHVPVYTPPKRMSGPELQRMAGSRSKPKPKPSGRKTMKRKPT